MKKFGGEAVIFSSLHPSGEKLKHITGIAAILRFDVVPLDEDEEDEPLPLPGKEEELEEDLKGFDVKKFSAEE